MNSIFSTGCFLSIWYWVKFITGCDRWPTKIYQRWWRSVTTKLFFGDRRTPPNYFFTARHLNTREVWQLWQLRQFAAANDTRMEHLHIIRLSFFGKKVGINQKHPTFKFLIHFDRMTGAWKKCKQGNWGGLQRRWKRSLLENHASFRSTAVNIPKARRCVKS